MTAPSPKEVRAARAYLFQHGVGFIRPFQFAAAAKEQDVGFKMLHRILEPWLGKKPTKQGGRHAQGKEAEDSTALPAR